MMSDSDLHTVEVCGRSHPPGGRSHPPGAGHHTDGVRYHTDDVRHHTDDGRRPALPGRCGAICLAVVLAGALPAACEPVLLDRVVARVNERVITQSDVKELLDVGGASDPAAWRAAVRELADRTVLLVMAEREGMKVSDEQVTRELERLDVSSLELGLSEELVRKRIGDELIVRAFVEARLSVRAMEPSLEKLREHYREIGKRFIKPEEVTLRIIALGVRTEAVREQVRLKAGEIVAMLEEGEDFAALSKKYSTGPIAARDGLVGIVERSALKPELVSELDVLEAGDNTGVIELESGFQIVKLEERDPERQMSFEEVKAIVRQSLVRQQQQQALRKLIARLEREVTVEIRY